jgi:hypothetical protein
MAWMKRKRTVKDAFLLRPKENRYSYNNLLFIWV